MKPPTIDSKIQRAYGHPCARYDPAGKVGIHDRVQIVEQETTLVRRRARSGFKVLFRQSKRAWPGAHLYNNPPEQRQNVQRAADGPAARPESSENYQRKPRQMDH